MFEWLGKIVERRWQVILVLWLIAFFAAIGIQAEWYNRLFGTQIKTFNQAATDGEFGFLPSDVQSLRGEQLLAKAYPDDLLKSSVVIVVRRQDQPLQPEDEAFIEETLKPRLEAIRTKFNADRDEQLIQQILTFKDQQKGRLLVSDDKEASLIVMPLRSEFLEWGNKPIIEAVEKLLYADLAEDPATHKSLI